MADPRDFMGKTEEFPMAVGAVTGVRAWKVTRDCDLYPLHVFTKKPWDPTGETIAECMAAWPPPGYIDGCDCNMCRSIRQGGEESDVHTSPSEECKCGIYAYHEKLDIQDWGFCLSLHTLGTSMRPVVGEIQGYGRTLIGEKGFRTEKARITKFFRIPGVEPYLLEGLHRKYPGIPIVTPDRPVIGPGSLII